MKEILDFCVSFFRNPALFMGLVVAIGLILQRKPIDAILKGIFKGITDALENVGNGNST